MRNNTKNYTASGFFVLQKRNGEWRILFLENFDGTYDIPKGKKDPGETALLTAIRETWEEASIKPDDLTFTWGNIHTTLNNGKLVLYPVEVRDIKPKIQNNPETNHKEHKSVGWTTIPDMKKGCVNYLRHGIIWLEHFLKRVDNGDI